MWGVHLSLDCQTSSSLVSDSKFIKDFFDRLIVNINMEKHGECQLEYFGKDNKKGWTYSQLITTSNICCHFCDNGEFYMDIFTCKDLDENEVMRFIENEFQAKILNSRFFKRGV